MKVTQELKQIIIKKVKYENEKNIVELPLTKKEIKLNKRYMDATKAIDEAHKIKNEIRDSPSLKGREFNSRRGGLILLREQTKFIDYNEIIVKLEYFDDKEAKGIINKLLKGNFNI